MVSIPYLSFCVRAREHVRCPLRRKPNTIHLKRFFEDDVSLDLKKKKIVKVLIIQYASAFLKGHIM